MKKLILIIALGLAAAATALASDLNVTSGNKKFFKTAQGGVFLEFIWDGATYDGKMPLEEKFTELEAWKKTAWAGFKEEFDDNCKKAKIVSDIAEANYKITMKVTKMDQYVKVMGWIPAPATKVWGTLTITDVQTGEVLLTAEVEEVDGGANPVPEGTFSDCFEELGEQVADLK